jgi:hypothetical protein
LFLSLIATSQVNYAPLVEQTTNTDFALDKFNEIDKLIINYVKMLFNIKDDAQAMNFAISSKDDGGLELILPGKYYHIMKCHQHRILTE